MEDVSAIIMYVGQHADDVWFRGPGYYYGTPTSWMTGPYSSAADCLSGFEGMLESMGMELYRGEE